MPRRKLLDPGLSASTRQNLFLNLLYKSMKADVAPRRVRAFIKRLLQVGSEQNPSFTCGALFLVSEVLKAKPGLKVLLQEPVVSTPVWTRSGPVLMPKPCVMQVEPSQNQSRTLILVVLVLQVQEEEEDFKDLSEDLNDEEEEQETFVDADRTADGSGPVRVKPTASWVHHQNLEGVWFWSVLDGFYD